MDTLLLNEHRCKCGKLLLKSIFFDGIIEIKCKNCGSMNKIANVKLPNDSTHYLFIINNKGIISNASSSATSILGYTREELIGKKFEFISPTINEKFFLKSILNKDNYIQLDTSHITKSGKKVDVSIQIKLSDSNNKVNDILVLVEVKNNLNKIKENNDPQKYINNSCDFHFDIDRDGISEYISPLINNFFNFPQESFIGKSFLHFMPISDITNSKNIFEYFSAREESFKVVENIKLQINNSVLKCEMYFAPKHDNFMKFNGYRVLVWFIKK